MLPRLRTVWKTLNKKKWECQTCTRQMTTTEPSQKPFVQTHEEFEVGNKYHNFLCVDKQRIEEFNMTAIQLQHERTKTEYLHIDRDDCNNVFSINFRTTPFSSAGVPHILEHTVLCGSDKYPVRDPFFKMLNRSMATFMNAMTGPDYTFYPFSTQNEVDYRNLQSIYLDAVFKPNLNRLDFLQEGWRLEHKNISDQSSDLIFKGVVYNEMKGAFSENSQLCGQKFINAILPDGTYGYVSGGDPLTIPELTHEQLIDFHQKYYHPSNAKIYSYGNFSLKKNLDKINSLYLSKFDYRDTSYSIVHPQKRWTEPQSLNISCRYDSMGAPFEKQNHIAIGLVMNDIQNVQETFEMQLLSTLMTVGPNSAFYKRLIEPNISGGYSSLTGYDPQMRDTLFVLGLQDLEVSKFDSVSKIFDTTIHEIIENGFEKDHVASVLNSIELGIKHQTTRFGLNMLFNLVALWNHGGSTTAAMKIEDFLKALKFNMLNDPKYLNKIVEKYFANNKHKLLMTMEPERNYEDKFAKKEADVLKLKVDQLSPKDKTLIYQDGVKLAEAQKKNENINILPCLKIKDITLTRKAPTLQNLTHSVVPIQFCEANTNGITYLRGVLDTSHLPENLNMLTPLFNAVISKFDTKNFSYREFDRMITLKTAGLSLATHLADNLEDPNKFQQGISIDSHCLNENLDGMLEIWKEIFHKPKLTDVHRFEMLLNNYVSSLTQGVVQSGHHYAMQMSQSLVSTSGALREKLTGVTHIIHTQNLSKTCSPANILDEIALIAKNILDRNGLRIALNAPGDSKHEVLDRVNGFIAGIPRLEPKVTTNEIQWAKDETSKSGISKGIHVAMNLPVNYCGTAQKTVAYTHADFAKLKVLARFLSLKYLHPIVREQNGAYGSGASIGNNGLFQFYSYRDPNSTKTLDIFDDTNNWLTANSAILDEQALFEAKLGVLQQLDAPVSEHSLGLTDFYSGLTYDLWRARRQAVLDVSKDDCMSVAKTYLNGKGQIGKCILGPGSTEILKRDKETWNVVTGPN